MKTHFVLLVVLSLAARQWVNANDIDFSTETAECKENEFFSTKSERCLECSQCGLDLYEKVKCSQFRDTVCDGCFAEDPFHNEDYFSKCQSYAQFYKQLTAIFKQTREGAELLEPKEPSNRWQWGLYALVVSISLASLLLSFWMFCMRRKYIRVINVTPPQLSDIDDHNIIYAAKHVREKLASKGASVPYEYL